jgi:hypothetical protein
VERLVLKSSCLVFIIDEQDQESRRRHWIEELKGSELM